MIRKSNQSGVYRLKPHLIRAIAVDQSAGSRIRTVRADALKPADQPAHDLLPPELIRRASLAYWAVGRTLHPDQTVDEWVNRFRLDEHPDREIAVWERIAKAFVQAGGNALSAKQRSKVALGLLHVSIHTIDVESQTGLSTAKVERLRAIYTHSTT